MKYLSCASILCVLAGCGIFGSSDSSDAAAKPAPAADPRAAEKAALRDKIDGKKQELAVVDADLSKITAEREQLANQPASEAKTNRLVELARLEGDTKQKRASISEEIANYEAQLSGGAVAAKPATAGGALDDILSASENKDKEDAERRRKKAEEDSASDKARLAQAEAARKAELDEQAKQKIEGGRIAQGADGPDFEERWADVIQKVRATLQTYKRW